MCADACVVRLVVAGFRRERLMAWFKGGSKNSDLRDLLF